MTIIFSLLVFIALSAISILISGAPPRVHLVDIGCFFFAFVFATLFGEKYHNLKSKLLVWIVVGAIGLIAFDVLSAYIIFKRELFIGWYIIYPIGILGLILLQYFVQLMAKHWPYNKWLYSGLGPQSGPRR